MISENSASFKSVLAPQQSPDLMLICLTFYQERINCLDNLKKGNTDLNFEKKKRHTVNICIFRRLQPYLFRAIKGELLLL